MNTLNGGQMMVDYLIRGGVPYAFGLCGNGNIGFIDALYERSSDIATLSVRHESVAGFMADVYYRVSGQPVATLPPCGPGPANMPICLANAFLNSVPFFAITGNVPTEDRYPPALKLLGIDPLKIGRANVGTPVLNA